MAVIDSLKAVPAVWPPGFANVKEYADAAFTVNAPEVAVLIVPLPPLMLTGVAVKV
jgi:hypothetical protein